MSAVLATLVLWVSPALATDFTVKPDGSGSFTTIQACADAARAGDTCLVYAGVYPEHARTTSGGTSDSNRITFKAQGVATTQGFDIQHPYVTVEGFGITGYTRQYLGHITVFSGGSNCQILNNSVRDGLVNVQGIYFYPDASYQGANGCTVRGNKLSRLNYVFLTVYGDNHVFEGNTFEYQSSMDFIRLFGANHVFRRNIFWRGTSQATGNHPDFAQTFGGKGKSENHLFEENWIQDLQSQFSQLDSGDGIVSEGILHDNIRNITFRRNVIINVAANSNIGMPGVRFESNTFYRTAYELSGINIGGSLTRGDPSRTALRNNVFLAGGARASTVDDFSGYYALSGGVFLREVIAVFVTRERDASGAISLSGPIAQALFDDVTKNGYIDGNGNLQARARELTDISKFVLNDQYSLYRQALYNYLVKTVQLDNAIRSTFVADYNFVAGAEAAGFPSKRDSGCISGSSYTRWNFCEPHGVNGGDPLLPNLANPLGPDGIPFTLDDGLKPLPTSPLCGRGEGGTDIGAYSCDPSKVFASSAPPQAPQNLKIVR